MKFARPIYLLSQIFLLLVKRLITSTDERLSWIYLLWWQMVLSDSYPIYEVHGKEDSEGFKSKNLIP